MSSSWSSQLVEARKFNDALRNPGSEALRLGSDLYRHVPKDPHENLIYRREWLELGNSSPEVARSIWRMCQADILWHLNTWCWTFNPRAKPNTVVPFITYPFQDEAVLDLQAAIANDEERLIEKSRDMGASWIVIYVFEHLFRFSPHTVSLRMLSRKEDLVDAPGDSDALFWKLDFIHKYTPKWLLPPMTRTSMHKENEATGSTIDGESTTADAGRGGRATAMLLDEFASMPNGDAVLAATADVTNCRLIPSTPKGQGNAYFRLKKKGEIKVLRFHWSQHPVKAKNLYASSGGELLILEGEQIEGYPYILDGKLRSPWYDAQCRRRTPMEIAQELDIDYLGSDYQFYEAAALDRISAMATEPMRVGELRYDPLSLLPRAEVPFAEDVKGRLRLWSHLDTRGRLVGSSMRRSWVIAADIAMGTGASNSAIAFGCRELPEQIGEIACPRTTPQDWAEFAIALAHWLKADGDEDPEIIFEANGPGRLFSDRLLKRQYPRIYWRTKDGRPDSKQTELAGWWSTPETKLSLMGEHRRALTQGLFTLHSQETIDELRQYVFRQGGVVEHAGAGTSPDPSGAKENHGDRAIASALLWHRIGTDIDPPSRGDKPLTEGTFAARQRERREKLKREQEQRW